jgi:hypothetical protein
MRTVHGVTRLVGVRTIFGRTHRALKTHPAGVNRAAGDTDEVAWSEAASGSGGDDGPRKLVAADVWERGRKWRELARGEDGVCVAVGGGDNFDQEVVLGRGVEGWERDGTENIGGVVAIEELGFHCW